MGQVIEESEAHVAWEGVWTDFTPAKLLAAGWPELPIACDLGLSDALGLVELASPWWYAYTSSSARGERGQEVGRSIDPEQPGRP